MGNCYFCGTPIEATVYRRSVCTRCGKELKICLNCEFYSPSSHWECHETIPEPVREKDRANFCDYFKLSSRKRSASESSSTESNRKAFDDLFSD